MPTTDNELIAFVRGEGGPHAEILTVHKDGSGERELTRNHVADEHPAWRSDGREIAFERRRPGSMPRVYVVDPNGANETSRVDGEYGSWAPDGRRFAFSASVQKSGPSELYVLENADIRQITHDGCAYGDQGARAECPVAIESYAPAWSPDGRWMAFVKRRATGSEVHLVSADGTGDHAVAHGVHAGHPAWSPDGRVLAWDDYAGVEGGGIYMADIEGPTGRVRNPHLLWRTTGGLPVPGVRARFLEPSWSPDGKHLAVREIAGGLAVIDPNGSVLRRFGKHGDAQPAWGSATAR